MAEGGFDNPVYGPEVDPDEWVPDDNDDEQDYNETTPFGPGSASTAGPSGGEEIPIQTMQHEKSGLPETSYAETSFGGRNITNEEIERRLNALRNPITGLLDTTKVDALENILSLEDQEKEKQRTKDFVKKRYPNADFSELGPIRFSTKKLMDIVVLGPNGGETKILLDYGCGFHSDFLTKLLLKKLLAQRLNL